MRKKRKEKERKEIFTARTVERKKRARRPSLRCPSQSSKGGKCGEMWRRNHEATRRKRRGDLDARGLFEKTKTKSKKQNPIKLEDVIMNMIMIMIMIIIIQEIHLIKSF